MTPLLVSVAEVAEVLDQGKGAPVRLVDTTMAADTTVAVRYLPVIQGVLQPRRVRAVQRVALVQDRLEYQHRHPMSQRFPLRGLYLVRLM
jgi:hypothetical protein